MVGNRRGCSGTPGFPASGPLLVPKVPKPPRPMDLVFAFVLSLAVVYDLRERRIPNALTMGGLLAALTLRLMMDPVHAWSGLQGAGLGLVVAIPLFALGAFGAGDGKLLVTVGGFMGLNALPAALLATGILGGILAMVYVWRRGTIIPALLQARDLALFLVTFGRVGQRATLSTPTGVTVPYGVAIAAGASVVWATGMVLP